MNFVLQPWLEVRDLRGQCRAIISPSTYGTYLTLRMDPELALVTPRASPRAAQRGV